MRLKGGLLMFSQLALTISVTAHAQFAPGVWDQLQHNGDRTIEARIEGVEISSKSVLIEYQEMVDDGNKGRVELCRESIGDHSQHEGWLSAVNNQRIEALRQAERNRQLVKISLRGPWSPCLSSVSTIK